MQREMLQRVTAVTNGSYVAFDETVPTLTSVGIASDNSTSTLAKVGDTGNRVVYSVGNDVRYTDCDD